MGNYQFVLTKPDLLVFILCFIVGAAGESDYTNNIFSMFWAGLFLGFLFLLFFKIFKYTFLRRF
jgi:hypothetical protein